MKFIFISFLYGGVAKWLNAADCKSAPSGFGGSNPSPSTIYGDCGEVVNAPDCGSGIRGFDSHQSPHFNNFYWAIAKR